MAPATHAWADLKIYEYSGHQSAVEDQRQDNGRICLYVADRHCSCNQRSHMEATVSHMPI
jgi:hypothetical protein